MQQGLKQYITCDILEVETVLIINGGINKFEKGCMLNDYLIL